jgi:ABC-2 type transport system permease protein
MDFWEMKKMLRSNKQKGPTVTLVPAGRSSGGIKDVKDLFGSRELLSALLSRELAGKYKGSFLGLGWTLIRPLVLLFIYAVVIGQFLGAAKSVEQFAIFVFVGLLFWNLISESISAGSVSMTANGALLKKVWFPREVLPLTSFAVATVNFIVQFGVLIFAFLIFNSWPEAGNLLYLIPVFLIVFPVAFGMSLILSVVNVRFRDTQYIVEVGLTLGFWLSPIVYPWRFAHEFLAALPLGALWQQIYLFNPFGLVVMAAQQALWAPISTEAGKAYQFFDSPFATRLWLSVLASWIFLYTAQRIFARMAGTVVVDL